MAYSTPAMVRRALAPNLDDPAVQPIGDDATGTAADLPDADLLDAISEADAAIDSSIGGRYAVPVDPVSSAIPHPIDFWSRNIAAYNATLAFRGSLDFTDDDPVARRWRQTVDALNAVRDGRASLPLPPVSVGTPGAGGAADPVNPYIGTLFDQAFTDELLGSARVPGQALDGYWYDGRGQAW